MNCKEKLKNIKLNKTLITIVKALFVLLRVLINMSAEKLDGSL